MLLEVAIIGLKPNSLHSQRNLTSIRATRQLKFRIWLRTISTTASSLNQQAVQSVECFWESPAASSYGFEVT